MNPLEKESRLKKLLSIFMGGKGMEATPAIPTGSTDLQRTNVVQGKLAQSSQPYETGKAFAKIEDPSSFIGYTQQELRRLFWRTPNSLDCAYVENNLPEGADSTRKIVVISVPLYKALMEIAAYHNNKPYRQREIEACADELTNRGVRQLIEMCIADFEDGYENVGQVLATVRKAKGT